MEEPLQIQRKMNWWWQERERFSLFHLEQFLMGRVRRNHVKIMKCHYEKSNGSLSSRGTEEESWGGWGSISNSLPPVGKLREGKRLAPDSRGGDTALFCWSVIFPCFWLILARSNDFRLERRYRRLKSVLSDFILISKEKLLRPSTLSSLVRSCFPL